MRADETTTHAMAKTASARRLWIVVPAFREETVIAETVTELRRLYPDVVVVDDGSPDGTGEMARGVGAVVLRHLINRGQGAALQTGIEYALRRGAEIVVTFDADGQHDPADIETLAEPIAHGEADIVLGSRFLGRAEGISWTRWLMLKGAVLFSRAVTGLSITDTHNGLRAFSRRAARRLDILQDGMSHASELLDQISRMELPYREVAVHIRYTEYSRAKGQSSLHSVRVLTSYLLRKVVK